MSGATSTPTFGVIKSSKLFDAPAPFTALAFTSGGELLAGGEDGSLRVYDLSDSAQRTLCKAVQGLPEEVSSICISQNSRASPNGLGQVWLASGKEVFLFDLDSNKMVIDIKDGEDRVTLIEEGEGGEDNVLNEIAVSKDFIAYSCDSGSVGVFDIHTRRHKLMRAMHANICGSVAFVPVRPREIVSGGYDSQLIHFDAPLGSVLSKLDMSAPASSGSSPISFSPPFVLSISMNANGAIATGTADGRLIIGRGGERGRGDRTNKRKWNGLSPELIDEYHIAEGPVVGVSWIGPSEVLTVSLGGQVKSFRLPALQKTVSPGLNNHTIQTIWVASTTRVLKVSGLATHMTQQHELYVAVGGLATTGRGCVEVWKRQCGTDTGSQ